VAEEIPEWLGQMEGILEALNEGVLIVDDCNQIVFANECLAEMTGRPPNELVGRMPGDFYSGDDLAFLNAQIALAEERGRGRYEFHVPRKDGSRVPVVVSPRMLEDPDGRRYSVVTFTDITEQKRVETALQQANSQLEKRQHEIELELELASRVQESLSPQSLVWHGASVETYYMPVRTIGGDFGLVAPSGNTHLNLLVCDVSGHGISSALIANRIYSETINHLERGRPLGEMMGHLNSFVLRHIRAGFYFTMAAARLDRKGRKLSFAGAGHPPALIIAQDGSIRALGPQSAILGVLEEAVGPQPSEDFLLEPGDRLMLYTDGLTEVFDQHGVMLGLEGLQGIVRENAGQPLAEMKRLILQQVDAWRYGPATDDVSIVLVEVA
jgi:sigma-B regulation protein RsbU (phosphoserine phosphatase)